MSLAARLADFALTARPSVTSQGAELIMAASLYDWMVCGMAGAGEPVARIVRDVADTSDRGCPVFGSRDLYPAACAAWINGATSHALDYDDTHFAHIGHPSVAVFPSVFALGGNDILWAALIGAETSVRVGQWLGRAHYQTGFHQTATAGAFGATAAAGRLIGLDHAQMQAAFGVTATQAAGLKSQFGTMGKPYHAGLAARTGVEAARLAAAGFDTRGQGLDGPQGFGSTHHGEGNLSAFDDLGTGWRMETVSHKFHACCHGLHAMLEALADCDMPVDNVAQVMVTTHPRWLTVCNIDDPATGLECKFSYRHTAAMALLRQDTAAMGSYSDPHACDPEMATLRQRVTVQTDDKMSETASRVLVTDRSGLSVEFTHDLNRPLPMDARTQRLRIKGRALLGTAREAELWRATNANRTPDMDALRMLMQTAV